MKPNTRLEWIALILLLVSGSVLTFLTPFLQIPDEPAHLCRAYQISEGVFLSPAHTMDNGKRTLTADVPAVLILHKYTANPFSGDKRYSVDDIKFLMSEPIANRRTAYIGGNTGQYSPLVYFPQAMAAYIARSLGAVTAGQIFYAMRFGAILFVALCIFLSIRLYPEKGLLIFLLSMMPMFLAEAASVSADAVTYGVCFLATSYLLALGRNKEKLRVHQMILLLLLSIAVGLAKQVYGTILLLYFLMPYEKLETRKRYMFFGLLLLVVCISSSMGWTYVSTIQKGIDIADVSRADVRGQVQFVLTHPIKVCWILLRTSIIALPKLAATFIGILGYLKLRLPIWFYPLWAVLIYFGAKYGSVSFTMRQKLLILFGSLSTLVAIFMYEYLTWTIPVGALKVEGLQGRYFIPIAFMFSLPLARCKQLQHERMIALASGILSVVVTITSTFLYFYK